MPTIMYIDDDGSESVVEVKVGTTVMQGAVDNMISGILAECGGACACATCHCYVDKDWFSRTGEASGLEADMLDAVAELKPTSRLSCQIKMTAELDGLIVRLPKSQY